MTLYELTEEAINQFDYYKHPNIDEWVSKIDDVLSALHEPTIGGDKIESLYFTNDTLEIRTSYSVRCCECSNDMSVPISILKDSEPVKKANQVYWSSELSKAEHTVSSAKSALERAYQKLEETKQRKIQAENLKKRQEQTRIENQERVLLAELLKKYQQ